MNHHAPVALRGSGGVGEDTELSGQDDVDVMGVFRGEDQEAMTAGRQGGRLGSWPDGGLRRSSMLLAARMPCNRCRRRHPIKGMGFGQGGLVSYPCTGIVSWWTVVQSCPVELEIGGNHPLLDVFSKRLGSRADSSPVGQRQVENRTVVQRHGHGGLDSAK